MITPCSAFFHTQVQKLDNWIQLVTYGDHAHPKGIQHVTFSTGRILMKHFRTLMHRFGWKRIPLYVGHPDDPEFFGQPGHSDRTIYGWVTHLKASDEGVWIKLKCLPTGRKLVARGLYRYLSPRWSMRKIDHDHYEPVRLISIGLTNVPNLKVEPLALTEAPEKWCNSVSHVTLKGCSQTKTLGQSRSQKTSLHHFVGLVHERMRNWGESYHDAWYSVKQSHPFLLE